MSNQTKNNNLNYLIDPTFTNVNRLFVLSFEDENEDDRTSFSKYYLPKVEIKNFNVLIDEKPFFEHMNKLLKRLKIMITRQVIYWIMNISKITTD